MNDLKIYTEAEAAEILRIPIRSLRNLRYRRKIAYLRGGYYRMSYLEKYLQSIEVLPVMPSKSISIGNDRSALTKAKAIIAKQRLQELKAQK